MIEMSSVQTLSIGGKNRLSCGFKDFHSNQDYHFC